MYFKYKTIWKKNILFCLKKSNLKQSDLNKKVLTKKERRKIYLPLLDWPNTKEDIRFPQTPEDWNIRKKIPKYWLITSFPIFPAFWAYELPAMVRYVHLADQRGAPPRPKIRDVGISVYLPKRHYTLTHSEKQAKDS